MRHLASLLIATVLAAGLLISAPALAEGRRVALVIGNSNYLHVPRLPNPANDADDLAQAFRRLGFEFRQASDLDDRGMRLALRDFGIMTEGADVAVIYYAGHGVQIDGINYMIPVNARLSRDADVAFEALPLETLLRAVEPARGLKLVFIDACRDNPFLTDMRRTVATRSLGRGLSKIEPDGVVVGFAARDGTSALDGQGRNSPYAAAILQHVEEPGLELGKFFRKVRDSVLRSTGGTQEPFFYGSLPAEDIFLLPAGQTVIQTAATPDPSGIVEDFAAASRTGTLEAWEAFLERYKESTSPLAEIGRQRRDELAAPAPVAVAPGPDEDRIQRGYRSAMAAGTSAALDTFLAAFGEFPDHPLVLKAMAARDRLVGRGDRTAREDNEGVWLAGPLTSNSSGFVLSTDQKRQVQRALNMEGYPTGGIDGRFGPKTHAAIRKARFDAGLPPGTHVDAALIRALPDAVATAALQSKRAQIYDVASLPEGIDPRLARVLRGLGSVPMIFDYHEGHLYVAVLEGRSWSSASTRARMVGGHLVTLGDLEEDRFVYRVFSGDPRFWFNSNAGDGVQHGPHIGLVQTDTSREPDGGWTWVTHEPMDYENWPRGSPDNEGGNQNYGYYTRPSSMRNVSQGPRYWGDHAGGGMRGFIVEVE